MGLFFCYKFMTKNATKTGSTKQVKITHSFLFPFGRFCFKVLSIRRKGDKQMTQQGRLGIKLLAEQAKKRLARNARVTTAVANYNNTSSPKLRYMQEKVLLVDTEEEELYCKLKQIFLSGDDVMNPIGQLIDQNKFKSMNALERDAYIVRTVEKFQKLKARLEYEKQQNSQLKIS